MRIRPRRKILATLSAVAMLGVSGAAAAFVTATPAGATTVTTEAQFRTAWDKDTAITLGADITLTCGPGSRADRSSTEDFVLDGMGHTITQTCAGGGVLEVDSGGGNGVVKNVTITGGSNTTPGSFGGGFFYDADKNLTLDHVNISNNTDCTDGGGLDFEGEGTLTITHSTIANNVSNGFGGAMWAGSATLLLEDSTLSANTASHSAAIEGHNETATYAYSTIVQNAIAPGEVCADSESGAVGSHANPSAAAAVEYQINMSENTATLTSFATVVALPLGGAQDCFIDPSAVTSQGYNYSDENTCGFTGTGDKQNASDPGLGALGANGGFAPTQVPQTGSPLLDAIPVSACKTGVASAITDDERDITRPQGTGCDVGAVEVEVTPPPPPPPTQTPAPAPAVTITPKFTG